MGAHLPWNRRIKAYYGRILTFRRRSESNLSRNTGESGWVRGRVDKIVAKMHEKVVDIVVDM
jgi:hypothetical protein